MASFEFRRAGLARVRTLMELFVCEDGRAAPPLSNARLEPETATALFHALAGDVEDLLARNIVHGDLSPYNILWNGGCYRIIDFPQAIDPRFNGNAPWLLARDLENVARFCSRFGEVPNAAELAQAMWRRFQRGELGC